MTQSKRLPCGRQIAARAGQIFDSQTLPFRVPPRRFDVLRRRVEARHRSAQPGQRLSDQPAAAADVQQPQTGKRPYRASIRPVCANSCLTQETETDGVDLVKRTEFPTRIPPLLGHGAETFDLRIIHKLCHGRVPLTISRDQRA